ncbi:MAG: DEAD/DEAH box helicase [Deltaproteobacteria bacterium]|nr:DEAD/DEAH box helicase [Deltaproteobacteria bacterium]
MPRLDLPIDPLLPDVVATLRARGVVVLQAPPGAGKTTRVPAAILDELPEGEIVVLEPRRLAARLSAKRVAEERGERVGETVGYDVRFDRAIGPKTRLSFVTEGILARRLLDDRTLRGVRCVVLDEFHERHLQTDLALGLLRRLRAAERPDLQIVVMSATLDAGPVAAFLGHGAPAKAGSHGAPAKAGSHGAPAKAGSHGAPAKAGSRGAPADAGDAPILTSEGRSFPVEVEHLPRLDDRPLPSQVASAVRELVKRGLDGDVLVFLPGAAEIRKCGEACAAVAGDADLIVAQLHGDLPPAQQDAAIARADRRKVILSTNVAETSVTIEGVVAVIDSGLARIAGHDPWTGRATLDVGKISRASAIQRAGRAGRVRPGRALRLYTKGDFDTRREHEAPEVARVDLADAVLMLHASRIDPRTFDWLTPPPPGAIDGAEALLQRLHALDPDGALSDTGRRMTRFPLPPRIARVLVEAERRGVADDACLATALLSDGRDIYTRGVPDAGATDTSSDLWVRMIDLRDQHGGGRIDRGAAARIERVRAQLARLVDRRKGADDPDVALRTSILAGFPDRVARRRAGSAGRLGASRDLLLCTGGSASLAESSVVRTAAFLVAVEAQDRRGQTVVWMASAIEPEWLIEVFPDDVRETVEVSWNAAAERVEATERMVYDKLVLDERPAGRAAQPAITRALVDRALAAGIGAFVPGDALDDLRARIGFLRAAAPDLADAAGIAPLDDEALRATLIDRCGGKRSFAELREAGLYDEIRASIGHGALSKLDELAPTHVALGNGRRVKVEYVAGQAPAISSRLQDFFGSVDTPRVARGRVPLVLHLLAPNGRDVQVTTDLAGFWDRHYPRIRSELMRRYPKHAWPEDPRTASPPELRRR